MAKRPARTKRKAPAPKKAARKQASKAPRSGVTRALARGARRSGTVEPARALADLKTVETARKLFWGNVLREILCALCMESMKRQHADSPPAPEQHTVDVGSDPSKIFDGRLAIITSWGARLPIAAIEPVLGVGPARGATAMSVAVECTVFQVRTTGGDVWTLPLHEIRGFHALTEQIMQALATAAEEEEGDQEQQRRPFGFKAFASLDNPLIQPGLPPDHTRDYIGE